MCVCDAKLHSRLCVKATPIPQTLEMPQRRRPPIPRQPVRRKLGTMANTKPFYDPRAPLPAPITVVPGGARALVNSYDLEEAEVLREIREMRKEAARAKGTVAYSNIPTSIAPNTDEGRMHAMAQEEGVRERVERSMQPTEEEKAHERELVAARSQKSYNMAEIRADFLATMMQKYGVEGKEALDEAIREEREAKQDFSTKWSQGKTRATFQEMPDVLRGEEEKEAVVRAAGPSIDVRGPRAAAAPMELATTSLDPEAAQAARVQLAAEQEAVMEHKQRAAIREELDVERPAMDGPDFSTYAAARVDPAALERVQGETMAPASVKEPAAPVPVSEPVLHVPDARASEADPTFGTENHHTEPEPMEFADHYEQAPSTAPAPATQFQTQTSVAADPIRLTEHHAPGLGSTHTDPAQMVMSSKQKVEATPLRVSEPEGGKGTRAPEAQSEWGSRQKQQGVIEVAEHFVPNTQGGAEVESVHAGERQAVGPLQVTEAVQGHASFHPEDQSTRPHAKGENVPLHMAESHVKPMAHAPDDSSGTKWHTSAHAAPLHVADAPSLQHASNPEESAHMFERKVAPSVVVERSEAAVHIPSHHEEEEGVSNTQVEVGGPVALSVAHVAPGMHVDSVEDFQQNGQERGGGGVVQNIDPSIALPPIQVSGPARDEVSGVKQTAAAREFSSAYVAPKDVRGTEEATPFVQQQQQTQAVHATWPLVSNSAEASASVLRTISGAASRDLETSGHGMAGAAPRKGAPQRMETSRVPDMPVAYAEEERRVRGVRGGHSTWEAVQAAARREKEELMQWLGGGRAGGGTSIQGGASSRRRGRKRGVM